MSGDDGAPIAVGGRVRPRVLAALLLDAGRMVSAAALVDAVWDGDAPATAEQQLRNTVPMLRKVVGGRVERIASDFRIRVGEAELDLGRFRRAVTRARLLRRSEKLHDALDELRNGLGQWRGGVLAGMPGRYFTVAARNLVEEQLAATEDRIDLELTLGEHANVIPELTSLLAEHPRRQRLTGQLMLALHRSGRTPSALEVYQRTRRQLNESLGIDPSRSLQDLHGAILRDDPALHPVPDTAAASPTVTGAGTSHARPPIPAQLPAGPTGFTGRHPELATLDTLLNAGTAAVTAIGGAGGSGKTALALHWAHRHREDFPDGQLYINLRGFDQAEPVDPRVALERFLTALGLPGSAVPAELDDAAALFRSMVADRRLLLLLDNARDASQVRPLLPGGSGNFVVVTSRSALTGIAALEGASVVGLSALSESESLGLLENLLGSDRVAGEPGAMRRLARLCGGLPLALRIAAANLATRPDTGLIAYVAELEREDRLDLLAVEDDPGAAVAATFEYSFRALEPDTRQVFVRLGLLPGEDFSDSLVREVTGLAEAEARTHLNRLRSAHLLEQHQPGRHRFHDLIRLYAAREAERTLDEAQRSEAVERYISWHHQRALTLPLAETVNIVAGISTLRDHPKVWQLVLPLQAVVYAGHVPSLTRQLIEAGLRQAEQQEDRAGSTQMTGLLGAWHCVRGDAETALKYGRRAMSMSEEKDPFTKGLASGNLGITLLQYGNLREAESLFLRALAIAETLTTVVWKQATDYYLALLYGCKGEFDRALTHMAEADELCGRQPTTNAVVINKLARAGLLIDLGRLDEAQRSIADVVPQIHKGSDNRARCLFHATAGELSLLRGDVSAALESFTEMRTVARRFGMSFTEYQAACRLAKSHSRLGDHETARGCLEPISDAELRSMGPLMSAEVALASAVVDNGAGSFTTALAHAMRAEGSFGEMPYPLKQAHSLTAAADAHRGRGDHEAARRCAEAAETILTRLRRPTDGTG